MAILLIDRAEMTKHVVISQTTYDDVLNKFINDAQFLDIQDLLGVEMYYDLLQNSTETNYTTLLDTGAYTHNGKNYFNVGLRTVISYYANARYIKFGSVQDTPFSLVEKTNDWSERVTEKSKQVLYKENQQIAFKYWRNVEAFLNRNKSEYPLWDLDGECDVRQYRTFRINKIV